MIMVFIDPRKQFMIRLSECNIVYDYVSFSAVCLQAQINSGENYGFDDGSGVGGMIARHYTAWQSGARVQGANPDQAQQFSRKSQTARLAQLLTDLNGINS